MSKFTTLSRTLLTAAALSAALAAGVFASSGDSPSADAGAAAAASSNANADATPAKDATDADSGRIPEPKQIGGEPDGIVQVANLVYAGTKSSTCFSDHFLVQAEKDSS